jgi:hypothetical protein
MSFLTCIAPRGGLEQVALRDLGESHGISERPSVPMNVRHRPP